MLKVKFAFLACLLLVAQTVAQTVGNWHVYSHLGNQATAGSVQTGAHDQHIDKASRLAIAPEATADQTNELDPAVCQLLDHLCAPTLLHSEASGIALSITAIAPSSDYPDYLARHIGHYLSTGPPPLQT
jgi:hypothetical protein